MNVDTKSERLFLGLILCMCTVLWLNRKGTNIQHQKVVIALLNKKCNTTRGIVEVNNLTTAVMFPGVCISHQIRALDKMTLERVSAERTECLQRIEQRTLQERLEAEKRQVTLTGTETHTGSAVDERCHH